MTQIRLYQDESHKWYAIPADKFQDFIALYDKVWAGDSPGEEFDFQMKYAKYKIGKSLNNIQLYADI